MRSETLTKIACLGVLAAGTLVLEGCGKSTTTAIAVAESPTPVLTPVEKKDESTSVLYIKKSLAYNDANFLISRKSPDSFIISDVTKKDSYLDTSINPVTLPAAITYMRENGCICGDITSFTNGINYQITVTNPEDCLPGLK